MIDNGSSHIRYGRSDTDIYKRYTNYSAISKKNNDVLMMSDMDKIFDESNYRYIRPHCRGILVNFDYQMNIWSKLFIDSTGEKNMKGYSLTLSNPIVSPTRSKEKLLEILFEYYGFSSVCIMSGPQAASFTIDSPVQLIVESGNACRYVVPILRNNVMTDGVKRLDIGGKLLTKILTQYICTKQVRLNDYYHTVENIKESMCYVSQDFKQDMRSKDNRQYYVLPDPDIRRKGYITDNRDDSGLIQSIALDNEKFIVPEHLFSPSLSNNPQLGIHESVVNSIRSVHPDLYGPLMKNISMMGGCTRFKGFGDRFDSEIRKVCDAYIQPRSHIIEDDDYVYKSLLHITRMDTFDNMCIQKQTYNDVGCSMMVSLI